MAKEQCVTALITDAMNELAANNVSIDKAILYKANFDAVRIARRNAQLNATLAEITELLNVNNIPSVILKGQGVAQNYRKPEQRMSGDIDLYVGEKNYDKAVNVLQEKYSKHA
ncbi:MAG TPA: nucleotidyltransferase family protein, partial [Candidatus Egerieousia sp.]|nr:nucleotidyltransferase family protein [Candidatus Egerieousia sp.]